MSISKSSRMSFSRKIRACFLALAVIAVLTAGVLPTCGGICCPVAPDAVTLNAQMPCCAPGASFAPSDALRLQPAAFAGYSSLPQTWVPVAVVAQPGTVSLPPRVQATLTTASRAHREPSSPLFLLNAQFLI